MASFDDLDQLNSKAEALHDLEDAGREARASLDPEVIREQTQSQPLDREAIEREARESMERERAHRTSSGHRPADRSASRFYEPGEGQRHMSLGFIVVVVVLVVALIAAMAVLGFGCSAVRTIAG